MASAYTKYSEHHHHRQSSLLWVVKTNLEMQDLNSWNVSFFGEQAHPPLDMHTSHTHTDESGPSYCVSTVSVSSCVHDCQKRLITETINYVWNRTSWLYSRSFSNAHYNYDFTKTPSLCCHFHSGKHKYTTLVSVHLSIRHSACQSYTQSDSPEGSTNAASVHFNPTAQRPIHL